MYQNDTMYEQKNTIACLIKNQFMHSSDRQSAVQRTRNEAQRNGVGLQVCLPYFNVLMIINTKEWS